MEPIYRIICYDKTDHSLTIRGGNVVLALTNHFDRYQLWIKDERHGATIKDSEGQPAFAVINNATGQAICHSPIGQHLVRYNVNSCDKSVLWTMSEQGWLGFSSIRRVDNISFCIQGTDLHDGKLVDIGVAGNDIYSFFHSSHLSFKFENTSPSSCITLFRPSQHTVKITCSAKVGYNLAIDKDGRTVLLVPSNPKDKYQHWIKEMAYGVPVKDEDGYEAFALVNKATGKAIKHGFGHNYLVQVALFNRNYMDPSLLWTKYWYGPIRMQHNRDLGFNILDDGHKYPLLALSKLQKTFFGYSVANQLWNIEDFE